MEQKSRRGEGVLDDLLSHQEIAQRLGVSRQSVYKVDIPRQRKGRAYLIHKRYLPEIKKYFSRGPCAICSKPIPKSRGATAKTCSKEHGRLYQIRYWKRKVKEIRRDPERALEGWKLEFFHALKEIQHLPGDTWVTYEDALEKAGVNPNIFHILWKGNILSSRPHPTKLWAKGRKVRLFSIKELDLLREIYEATHKESS